RATLVAGRSLSPLSHGSVPTRCVAAVREHRDRLLVAAMADRSDSGDYAGRAAAVAALTIVAALLRIPLLSRPMGNDEAATFLYYASRPLSVIVTIYGSPNNHILHSI